MNFVLCISIILTIKETTKISTSKLYSVYIYMEVMLFCGISYIDLDTIWLAFYCLTLILFHSRAQKNPDIVYYPNGVSPLLCFK